jgi:hypothetical protein
MSDLRTILRFLAEALSSSDLKGTPRMIKKDILSGAICSRGAAGEKADSWKLEFRFGDWPTGLRQIGDATCVLAPKPLPSAVPRHGNIYINRRG